MILFVLRRLGWTVVTLLGVMVVTFALFRMVAGDIAAANNDAKATEQTKAAWRQRHGYDLPLWINVHRRLVIEDKTAGSKAFNAVEPKGSGSNVLSALALILGAAPQTGTSQRAANIMVGRYVSMMSPDTPIEDLIQEPMTERSTGSRAGVLPASLPTSNSAERQATSSPQGTVQAAATVRALIEFSLADGSSLTVDLTGARTAGELLDRVNRSADNRGRLLARISENPTWTPVRGGTLSYPTLLDSQFFHHLWQSMTFSSHSLKDNRLLLDVIGEKGPYSLALTVPAMAVQFVLALAISVFVAYFRGTSFDRAVVFLCVLGMCVPFLAYMMYGQQIMEQISPRHAYGIHDRVNIYVPIAIMVAASVGGMVRFYRAVILDETHRDYVRTAKAKGLPLPTILFKHVLRNCMLPILTNVILTIPFLIMGSLLVESFFGIPGLGNLMITSIANRDEPIMSGMVFLTAMVYSLGVLLTDISYALFDPRVRLG